MENTEKGRQKRLNRALEKAKPFIIKYDSMTIEEKLSYLKNNRELWKKEHNIINRYYNLYGRFN
jgi:hypothetical protein